MTNSLDLKYTPRSYWEDRDPLQAILRNVTGRARREMITDFWNAGRIEELNDAILGQGRPEGNARLEAIHPFFMGGEYLPEYLPGEVEIARINLDSTTFDVISIRARPTGNGIGYRIVDEYNGAFEMPFTQSKRPLSTKRMIALIEKSSLSGWPVSGYGLNLDYTVENYQNYPEAEELCYFATVSSDFYPGIADYFNALAETWRDETLEEEREAAAEEEAEEERQEQEQVERLQREEAKRLKRNAARREQRRLKTAALAARESTAKPVSSVTPS